MKLRAFILAVLCSTFLLSACTREYTSELMNAAKGGDVTAVQHVLDRGADVNEQSNKGKTALMFAASEGHTDVARLLLEQGANVNIADNYGTTALIVAATSGHHEVVALLLENGANPEVRDQNGSAPLVNAIYFGHTIVIYRTKSLPRPLFGIHKCIYPPDPRGIGLFIFRRLHFVCLSKTDDQTGR